MLPITAAVDVLSVVGLLLFMLVLSPQVWLNYRKGSTEGLSKGMLLLFLLGALTPGTYYLYSHEPVALTAAWVGFAVLDIVVLTQMWYYDEERRRTWSDALRLRGCVAEFVFYIALSVLLSALTYLLFLLTGPSSSPVVAAIPRLFGYVLPAALTIAGYVVQIRLIVQERSAEGVSPGFIVMDLVGCSASIAAIALNDFDGAAVAPLVTVIACQLCMAALYFVYPPPPQRLASSAVEQRLTAEDRVGGVA